MSTGIALLGCGNFGYDLAKCLVECHGRENLYLTNRDPGILESYAKEFPQVFSDNQAAADRAEILCILVRPAQVKKVLENLHLAQEKLLVNFTPKRLSLDSPLLEVACSPVIGGRIKVLLYQPNSLVSEAQMSSFLHAFLPLADYHARVPDSARALGYMSQVYAHLHSYFLGLKSSGLEDGTLLAMLDMAASALHEPRPPQVMTRAGLTEALEAFHQTHFDKFIRNETVAWEDCLKWMQAD